MTQLALTEKIGYATGDAAANLVWRGALAYLAVFYTDTFGISAAAAAMLFLVVRLSDGITDIIMGMIADRTDTKYGKFRPWILWSTPFLGLFMVLCFTTPNLSESNKLIYAYLTYIGLTLAYTVNNVPYSALMGVMTGDDKERTSLSGFRFAGAFLGGLFVMGFLPQMVEFFGQGDSATGYQYTMYVFAGVLCFLMFITVISTKERIRPPMSNTGSLSTELKDLCKNLPFIVIPLAAMSAFFYYRNWISGIAFIVVFGLVWLLVKRIKQRTTNGDGSQVSSTQRDMLDLLDNKPWLILLGIGFLTMMFNGIKYGVIAYYFKYYVGDEVLAGSYFVALLVISIAGALATSTLSQILGRRKLFIIALLAASVFTTAMFWIPQGNVTLVFSIGCIAEFFAAIMPTLYFSMLGDSADYSEWKNGRRATGLVYSAGTFVQKTGGGFAGALVLLVLASFGYDGMDASTVEQSLTGMVWLMSWIPSCFAIAAAVLMLLYPISDALQQQMTEELATRRLSASHG